jgi:hypothetical protein
MQQRKQQHACLQGATGQGAKSTATSSRSTPTRAWSSPAEQHSNPQLCQQLKAAAACVASESCSACGAPSCSHLCLVELPQHVQVHGLHILLQLLQQTHATATSNACNKNA